MLVLFSGVQHPGGKLRVPVKKPPAGRHVALVPTSKAGVSALTRHSAAESAQQEICFTARKVLSFQSEALSVMKAIIVPSHPGLNRFLAPLFFFALTLGLATRAHADVQVNSLDGNILGVHFDGFVQGGPSVANFTVYGKATGAITVTNVVLQEDQQTVALYLNANAGEFFVVTITNVLTLINGNFTLHNTTESGCLYGIGTASIGSTNDPSPVGQVVSVFRDTFNVSAAGSDIGGTNDHCHFVGQQVIGNFEMAALVTRLDNSDPNAKAGLMAREFLTPGSRSFGIYFTPLNAGTNQIQTVLRITTNGVATNNFLASSSLKWLRMTRTNNTFTTYFSTNGGTWTQFGTTAQSWNSAMNVGAAVTSRNNGHTTTAGFDSFGIAGARSGDGVVPTLSVAVVSNLLVAKWQRTPRDFAVQVTDNMGSRMLQGSATNTPPEWAFLLLPINDTSLTGTNAYMPTPGRYMTIPLDLFTNKAMFVRLTRVEKVFPDPVDVKGGLTLSQAAGNLAASASGDTLCSATVNGVTAMATTNSTYVICVKTNSYQFTTGNSGASVRTVLQLRNKTVGLGVIVGCDGSYSAGSYKAQVTVPYSGATSNYTFVAVATADFTPTPACPIVVDIKIK